jgi:glycosyltransferase involved in cell wall biosynthesis
LKKNYFFPIVGLLLSIAEITTLFFIHDSLQSVVLVMTSIGIAHFIIFSTLHLTYTQLRVPLQNVRDLLDLFFERFSQQKPLKDNHLRVLILNWRDTKHVWAGGAEIYIQSIARRLSQSGHKVTMFCGNDGKSPRNEVVENVQIIRRGGFYTVYFWAFVYYVFRLRNLFDIVIDCENGIPFLSPLYVRKPIFLLIHHVHRDVFVTHLIPPLAVVARTIEEILMPLLYRNRPIFTISNSSRAEVASLGISNPEEITIIHPGVVFPKPRRVAKTEFPSLCYVGRLKPYKNVDILIKAFAQIQKEFPKAQLSIAGFGESEFELKKLVRTLSLEKSVHFLGKISESEKEEIYAKNWLAVQPSMIEGWGITVIEANTLGTPVVAADVKGLRDSVVNHVTGVLVPSRNISALSECIAHLFKNPKLLQKYGKAAKERSKQFSWDHSAQQVEAAIVRHLHELSLRAGSGYLLSSDEE